jgi:hypothetical protein
MKTVKMYLAEDGMLFETEQECLEHEYNKKFVSADFDWYDINGKKLPKAYDTQIKEIYYIVVRSLYGAAILQSFMEDSIQDSSEFYIDDNYKNFPTVFQKDGNGHWQNIDKTISRLIAKKDEILRFIKAKNR